MADQITVDLQNPGTAARPQGMGINVGRSLRRHKSLAVCTTFLILAAGLPYAWIRGAAKYSSTAVIYISPRFVANLQDGKEIDLQSDSQYHEYIQQSARTINRFDIVLTALKGAGSAGATWLKPKETMEHAAERLQGALDITPVPDTYQIAVSLEGDKASGLADLVNSVVNTYLRTAKSEEFYDSDQRVKNLLDDRARLQQEVDAKQSRRLEIAQDLGISSFSDNFVNPYDRLLVEAKEALSVADRQKIEADAQIGAVDDKQRPGGSAALQALASQEAVKDTALTTLNEKLNIRRAQIMSEISGLSPEHPGRRAAERELSEIDKQLDQTYQKLVNSYSRTLLSQREADDYKAAQVEQKLRNEVEDQASQAAWFSRNYQEGMQLGAEIDAMRKQIDSVQQRIDFLSLEKSAPGFSRLFSGARVPDQPSSSGRRRLFLVVLAGALMMGLLAPVASDQFDSRLHSPADVERILGFAPMGWLIDKNDAGTEFAREQVLRLANRLAQDCESSGSRIFAFTSVKARGGTSTIVFETAAALGRLGISALAVEANAYRADPRYRNPRSRGLTVVLKGNHSLGSAVIPAEGDMPDYVPIGDTANEKNLPDIKNLVEVLKASTAEYGAILVDLPPILVSVDAEFLARAADVAVLVIEAENVNKQELVRAAASLERLQVRAVSAVLNRVRIDTRDGTAEAALEEFQMGSLAPKHGWFGRRRRK